MTRVVRQIAVLTGKDLRIEARSRETIGLVVVLGILILVVLGLGLGRGQIASGAPVTAILWVAYLFGGVLCFEKTMAVERHDGALAALLMAPVDRSVIYVAKWLSNFLLMLALAVVVTPVAILFFNFDLSAAPLTFSAVMLLGFVGFAAVGTLFAAAVSSSRLQGGLLAMVIFPICLPLVIASTQIITRLHESGAGADRMQGSALAVLVAFDVIYLIVSWLVFELILEP